MNGPSDAGRDTAVGRQASGLPHSSAEKPLPSGSGVVTLLRSLSSLNCSRFILLESNANANAAASEQCLNEESSDRADQADQR